MDKYIQMCDCEEIQNKWKICNGDAYIDNRHSKEVLIVRFVPLITWARNGQEKWFIWLPRQDQLQDMIEFKEDIYWIAFSKLRRFYYWLNSNHCGKGSMEELWLAFIMEKLHNKIWEKDKWIKQC